MAQGTADEAIFAAPALAMRGDRPIAALDARERQLLDLMLS